VLSAGDRLIVLYTGADPVSGALRPPAVPVGELLDAVEAMAPGSRDQVVRRHPLQPYDIRAFTGATPFSFDPVSLAGAVRADRPRRAPSGRAPLPPRPGPVGLAELVSFVEHPVRGYLRGRLGLTLPGEDDEVADALSVTLDALQEWAVGERLLDAALRGLDPAASRHREWLRGTLPPGPLGGRVLQRVQERVTPVAAAAAPLLTVAARSVDVRLELDGQVLSGTVNGVRDGAVVAVSYSSLSARHRIRAWVLALVLAVAAEGDRAVTVGRWSRGARTSTITAPPEPRAALAELLELYARGSCEPLPLLVKTSAAYAASRLGGNSVEQATERAAQEWRTRFGGEQQDRHHRYVWGDDAALTELLAAPPGPTEGWPGESTRFGALACRLWSPVRQAEELA
jgi:exodeoxyribonuclease V gamma subunit